MNDVAFPYALDENGNFVCINDFTKENIIGHVYKCPACGCEMRPRLGLKNKHHFYHKGESCEGYLHEVAKLLIKDIFDRSERFYIALEKYCDRKNDCPFVEKLNCSHVLTHFNLKDYYDTCSIETRVEDGFIPDVLLTHSEHKERELYIEIFVTHACSEEKINSGKRIVELELNTMEDLLRMTNSFNCEGSVYPSIDESFRNRFYNFNRLLKTKYKFKRVDVFEDDTWNITDLMCGNLDVKNNENAILNFIYLENGIVSSKIKDFIEYVKIKNKIIRSCDFCYYRDFSLLFPIEFQCKRQGRFTNPIQEAQRCIMYSVQNVPNVKNEFSDVVYYVIEGRKLKRFNIPYYSL
jgi:hypothetical protein